MLIEPSLALLTDSLSFCLLLLMTSFASTRADLTSPFVASCLTVARTLLVAKSNYKYGVSIYAEGEAAGNSNLPHLPVKMSLFCSEFRLPCPNSFFRRRSIKESVYSLHTVKSTDLEVNTLNSVYDSILTNSDSLLTPVRHAHASKRVGERDCIFID